MPEFDIAAMKLSAADVEDLTETITGTPADVPAVDLPQAIKRFNLALIHKVGRERAGAAWQDILMEDVEGAANLLDDELGVLRSTPPDPAEPGVVRVVKRRGRPALAAGKDLVVVTPENPHGVDAKGYASMQLLYTAPQRKLTYEQYRAGGGTPADLTWAVNHGHVEVRDPVSGHLLNQPGVIAVSGSGVDSG